MQILAHLRSVDLHLFDRLFRLGDRRFIVSLARAWSHSGDGHLHLLAPLLLVTLGAPEFDKFLPLFAAALVGERLLYFSLKNALKRRRPADYLPGFHSIITASDQFSFPSGHSSGAFLLATALCIVYGTSFAFMLAWAAGVALSRVILGVHFPGDIVAGGLMGSSITALTAIFMGVS